MPLSPTVTIAYTLCMDSVCRIEVDSGESRAVVAALAEEGLELIRTRLRVGDYGLPGGTLVERKAVRDLHLSIHAGRFWRQIGALRTAAVGRFS